MRHLNVPRICYGCGSGKQSSLQKRARHRAPEKASYNGQPWSLQLQQLKMQTTCQPRPGTEVIATIYHHRLEKHEKLLLQWL
jgi:hypothetical protein